MKAVISESTVSLINFVSSANIVLSGKIAFSKITVILTITVSSIISKNSDQNAFLVKVAHSETVAASDIPVFLTATALSASIAISVQVASIKAVAILILIAAFLSPHILMDIVSSEIAALSDIVVHLDRTVPLRNGMISGKTADSHRIVIVNLGNFPICSPLADLVLPEGQHTFSC